MKHIKVVFDKKENQNKINIVNDYLMIKIKKNSKFKLIKSIFLVEENEEEIDIFFHDFVMKNRKKCIIILKNQKYPLVTGFILKNKNIRKLKMNLIYFGKKLSYLDKINYMCRADIYEYSKLNKVQILDLPKIRYTIRKNENKIKIFGKEFVKENIDKFIIQYKDKIFNLKKYFNLKDIDKLDNNNKLELSLIKLKKNINMRAMFYECISLEEFILPELILNDSKENSIQEGDSIISENSKINNDKSFCQIINNDNSLNKIKELNDLSSITYKSEKIDIQIIILMKN